MAEVRNVPHLAKQGAVLSRYSLLSSHIRKYSRINQKISHLFCSHKDSPYFCCVYPTPVARRCASNVCEGASGWCSIAQPARGFRVWKPREHTYNIYIRRASTLLCHWFVETWEISRFEQWWMPEVMLTGMLSMYAKVCAVDITSYFISPVHF